MTRVPRPVPGRRGAGAAREERLARALRDNLRRRKEQARARAPRVDDAAAERPTDAAEGGEPAA
jgi:hypothetical protein